MSFENVTSAIVNMHEQCIEQLSHESACPATTSRALSPSSGDHDDSETYSFCSRKCSCCSTYRYVYGCREKPLAIVDSTSKLNKSKWHTFKKYLKRRIKTKRNNVKKETVEKQHNGVYDSKS